MSKKEFNLKNERTGFKSNLFLAIYGAGCTKEYAEKTTEELMSTLERQDKEFIKMLKQNYAKNYNVVESNFLIKELDKLTGEEE